MDKFGEFRLTRAAVVPAKGAKRIALLKVEVVTQDDATVGFVKGRRREMDEHTKAEWEKTKSEIDAAISSLDRAESLEYRRRKDIVNAVLHLARLDFRKLIELRASHEPHIALKRSQKAFWLFLSACAVGGLWHYFFTDRSKDWDWTLGSSLIVLASFVYASFHYETYKFTRDLREQWDRCNELRYRWMANGCSVELFWGFRDMIVAHGDDFGGTDENERWWLQLEGELLNSITGERKVKLCRL